jgi:hypothetical protein
VRPSPQYFQSVVPTRLHEFFRLNPLKNIGFFTKVQLPLRLTTRKDVRLGVLSGSGLQASFSTEVFVEVAKIGRALVVFKGRSETY